MDLDSVFDPRFVPDSVFDPGCYIYIVNHDSKAQGHNIMLKLKAFQLNNIVSNGGPVFMETPPTTEPHNIEQDLEGVLATKEKMVKTFI